MVDSPTSTSTVRAWASWAVDVLITATHTAVAIRATNNRAAVLYLIEVIVFHLLSLCVSFFGVARA
jgi:hypothetical protein